VGPTRTRYTHGSACAYRMTTGCSGAIERPAVGTAAQACSTVDRADYHPDQRTSRRHPAAPLLFGDSPAARGKR
jgi:hypothetical protein